MKGLEYLSYEESERLPPEEQEAQGILPMHVHTGRHSAKGARFFPVMPRDRTGGNGYMLRCRRLHLITQKHFVLMRALAQNGGGVSILGDMKNLMGHSPEQLAAGVPA